MLQYYDLVIHKSETGVQSQLKSKTQFKTKMKLFSNVYFKNQYFLFN